MNYDARYVVRRLAPVIGRPESARRQTIAGWRFQSAHALDLARRELVSTRAPGSALARSFGVGRAAYWIEARGASAVCPAGRRKAWPRLRELALRRLALDGEL